MIVCDGKLITGGASQNLCLWSVTGVANLRNTEDQQTFVFISFLFNFFCFYFSLYKSVLLFAFFMVFVHSFI